MTLPIEKQVVSLPLAERLDELGVKQESYWMWLIDTNGNAVSLWERGKANPHISGGEGHKFVPAHTVAELGELLPARIRLEDEVCDLNINRMVGGEWLVHYIALGEIRAKFSKGDKDKLADAMAYMLIYLIEQGLINNK